MSTIKIFDTRISLRELVFTLTGLFCVSPWVSPPAALTLGLFIALFVGHPFLHINHRAVHMLLQCSVIGLGFGMDAGSALKAGRDGILFAMASIAGTLTIGWLLGKILKIDKKTSLLISGGTAICGGSAIAALSPVIGAEERQVSVAMGTVFILNSAALFLFPVAGRWLHLSQAQFGLWAAIAIHDTSSVVGAAGRYGPEALQIATTVKLARALWIIPVSLMAALFFRGGSSRIRVPWFIGVFVLAVLLHTWMPMPFFSHVVVGASHAGMTLTLFLIGCGLSRQVLLNTGVKPLVQGIVVWLLIAGAALWAVIALA
ncbi:putative sulfate exporter family transporter [Flavitalea sp. BT771]|uniref:YeiH family protein n=1 Tax=Flavitalea sp. BT771 TaxID=3063329 RepID=UPI0026E1318A|nr:putative sulfate exporter family transporter [Flavitalea sp. BT771]MDO6435316.1 putative sulfate exporter family transporter [Flavitalea sp. BT771]MDV6224324.1 putative sulfate exporter family transporter [Flavitalea sp. BT771]